MTVSGAAVPGRTGHRGLNSDPGRSAATGIRQRTDQPSGDRGQSSSTEGPRTAETKVAENYCAVTIVCGVRQLDLALPTTLCCADLLPGLLRLMLTDEEPALAQAWVLAPIGRSSLSGSETLADAGVLVGEVLMLRPHNVSREVDSLAATTRDRIEDAMSGEGRFWGPTVARRFANWATLIIVAALLLPTATLPTGPVPAALAATVAGIVAMTAIFYYHRSEKYCAAVGLGLGCVWAALAGVTAFHSWAGAEPVDGPAADLTMLMVALGSALLLAGCVAAGYPAALVLTTALLVVGVACAALVIAVNAGAKVVDASCVGSLMAVLLLGALPRVALATGGFTGGEPSADSADPDDRIGRADRVLIGCLAGASVFAAGAVAPAALSGEEGPRLLAAGIGLLILLRSRSYSQTRHVFTPRVGGLFVFGVVWLGSYLNVVLPRAMLIVGTAVAVTTWAVGFDVLDRGSSPVGRARRARFLDLAEQALVVALIVAVAWVVALDDWVVSVMG